MKEDVQEDEEDLADKQGNHVFNAATRKNGYI